MPRFTALHAFTGLLLAGALLDARAATVIPLKGQTPEQIQADVAACQSQAGSTQASSSSQSDDSQGGGRARGAARGAVAGA
ncbi:hypothetical protein ACFOGZ_07920, partial [Azotobacter chroococcum]